MSLGLRRDLVLAQLFGALGMPLRMFKHSPCLGERRFCGIELDFKPGRVNAVKDVASLHLGALLEQSLHYDPGYAGANFRNSHGRDTARQLPDDRPWDRLNRNHCYLRGRLCLLRFRQARLVLSSGQVLAPG